MGPTIREIAEACGVSRPTANLILTNKGARYSAQTRAKVLAAAKRMGYLPHSSARALVMGKVAQLGLLTSTVGARSAVASIVPGIQAELREHDMSLTIAELPDQQLTDAGFVPKILREYSVGGFLIGYTHDIPSRMRELIAAHQIPSIWLNAKVDHDCVYPDDVAGARAATERLLEMGHRRIAYVTYMPNPHHSHADRWAGYALAMRDAGLPTIDCRSERYLESIKIPRHTRRVLAADPRPTAVVCYEAYDATHLITGALSMGLRVPADLSVVTVSEADRTMDGLHVATSVIPFPQIGRNAVGMMLRKLKKRGAPLQPVVVPMTWVEGNTITLPQQ